MIKKVIIILISMMVLISYQLYGFYDNDLNVRYMASMFFLGYIFSFYAIYIKGNKELTLQLIFFLTYGLFVGGRLIAYTFGYKEDPFMSTFFMDEYLSSKDKYELINKLMLFSFFFSLGCCFIKDIKSYKIINRSSLIDFISKTSIILFPFFLLFYSYTLFETFKNVISLGYTALYLQQGAEINSESAISSIIYTFLLFILGCVVSNGNKKAIILYLGLFLLLGIVYLLIGARAKFAVSILLIVYLFNRNKKIKLVKFFIFCVLSALLINYISLLSIRFQDSENEKNIIEILSGFVYSQGVTMMVISLIDKVGNYPALAFYQLFIPAISTVTSFFTEVQSYSSSFGNFLSYSIDRNLYLNGNGLGWSIIGDIYLLSGRIIPFYILLSLLFGSLLSIFNEYAKYNIYIYSLYIMLFTKIIYLPRASLNSTVPMISWFFIFMFIFYCMKIVKKRLNK